MSPPKRTIAYVVPDLYKYGGIQTYANDQLDRLRDEFAITALSWTQQTKRALELLSRALPPSLVGRRAPTQGHLEAGHSTLDFAGFDLVHYWHFQAAVDASSSSTEQRTVVTCHGSEILRSRLPRYHYHAARRVLEGAHAIVTPSEYTKRYLQTEFGIRSTLIHVIHPGISRAHLEAPAVCESARDDRTRNIGVIARLIPRKNIFATIDAAEAVSNRSDYRVVLHVAGDGPLREQVVSRLRTSFLEAHYHGPVKESEKWESFLPMLDVFVLPALSTERDVEGFGISYLEANALGVPVVATRLGGAVDAVSEGLSGIFANSPCSDDVATAILSVLADSNLRSGARTWAHRFQADHTAALFANLYDSLISTAGTS